MVVEMYEETAQLGLTLKMPMAHGILEVSQNKQHIFRLETNIWFPQVQCYPALSTLTQISKT